MKRVPGVFPLQSGIMTAIVLLMGFPAAVPCRAGTPLVHEAGDSCLPSGIPMLSPIPSGSSSAVRAISTPVRLAWPLAWPLDHPHLRIVDYVDEVPTNGIVRDYMGGNYCYDGHQGTDINLNSFQDMDAGVPILAAAPGRVVFVQDQNFDREVDAPHSVQGNGVVILHEDGTAATYWHLRTNSATVRFGDYVREGQMLGMVGSAGTTTNPHLHFQINDWLNVLGVIDPWGGAANPLPSRWKVQEPYVGDIPFRLMDLSVTTNSEFSNEGGLGSWMGFKNRPSQPAVFGADEPTLKIWSLVSGITGTPFSVEVRRPDGTVFAHLNGIVPVRANGQTFQYWDLPFTNAVSPTDYGPWTVQAFYNGAAVFSDTFVVGETSRFPPRFYWVGGRSFHLTSERQEDVLSMSYLGTPAESLTFALENAPSNVSLRTDEQQTIVVIDPMGPDLLNVPSREFTVSATDPSGLQDRMHYHLVNNEANTLGSSPVVRAPTDVSGSEGDTVTVEVSTSDPEGDPISGLTADLTGLPVGNAARFETASDRSTGRLIWPTKPGEQGSFPVVFHVETSLGGIPQFGFDPIVQSGSATTLVTIRTALSVRAFTSVADRVIRLFAQKPFWCVHVQSMDGTFEPSEIDPTTVQLVSSGTGTVDHIGPILGDQGSSVPRATFCFSKDRIRDLFSHIVGKQTLELTLVGQLRTGAAFSGTVEVDVIGNPPGAGLANPLAIAPNPARGDITFRLRAPRGVPCAIDVFNLVGQRVRHIDLGATDGAARIFVWNGRDQGDAMVGAGVYWVRLQAGNREWKRRIVLLK